MMMTWRSFMIFSAENFTLKDCTPRPEQTVIIEEILTAIENGYRNIILEAGTGTGKSAIATTIANYVENSYIVTMTNQLLQQYLHDFNYMVKEIKGRSNYSCNFKDNCDNCHVKEENNIKLRNYNQALKDYKSNPNQYAKPEKPILLNNCGKKEEGKAPAVYPFCPYIRALKGALKHDHVISNYDYLYIAGNYAGILPERDLVIFDEAHNLEKKIMQLITSTLNRKTIYRDYEIDIFDGITEHNMTLKSISEPKYWIGICEKLVSIVSNRMNSYIDNEYGNNDNSIILNQLLENDDVVRNYNKDIEKYDKLIKSLKEEKWIIELPTKKDILADDSYLTNAKVKGLTVEFKPLTVSEYTESLFHFGKIRLFMTGTLGSKDKFCNWLGIDPNETYYIYQKSPFPVEHRPIIRDYAGKMSGRNKRSNLPNWKNEEALIKIHDILEEHPNEKGVIHVSSNEQAWYIRNELNRYLRRPLQVAYGRTREESIEKFEEWDGNMVLIGAGIKDGVDFKGDKCRFQILFKMPFPNLGGAQVNIRKRYDLVWYIYQTVMPLMQAYGRGIRDDEDYCVTYVLDSDFESLINDYTYLFNEYFIEAIEDFTPKQSNGVRRVRRVKRVPRAEAK